jgi:hypothetical protein
VGLALVGLCWLGPIVMAYRCGQGHPRKPVAIVAQEQPSVEINDRASVALKLKYNVLADQDRPSIEIIP